MILMIGLIYSSLHSNHRIPHIKASILSPYIFSLYISNKLLERKGEEVKAQGGVFFDAQSCHGEGSKDHDRSRSSITLCRTSATARFVK